MQALCLLADRTNHGIEVLDCFLRDHLRGGRVAYLTPCGLYVALLIPFLIYIPTMAAFTLRRQSWLVVTENIWLANSKIFTNWLFSENVCQHLIWLWVANRLYVAWVLGKLMVVSLRAICRTGEEPHEGLFMSAREVWGLRVCTYLVLAITLTINTKEKILHETDCVLRDGKFVSIHH